MAFEPVHGLGVEMVGRLVQQQQFRLLQQQLAQRDAALLAARQVGDLGGVRRADQGLHGLVDLGIEIPQALGLDLVLQHRHLVRGLVGIVHRELVVAVEHGLLSGDAFHHALAHGLGGIELRLLGQVADAGAFRHEALATELGVDACHDPQQRALAGPVDAQHADLGVGIKRQVDVLQYLPVARISLGETLHVVDELPGHCAPLVGTGSEAKPPRSQDAIDTRRFPKRRRLDISGKSALM
jgi:hypothetical protein